jgi:tetratricopeptide (TPR) repeat protein
MDEREHESLDALRSRFAAIESRLNAPSTAARGEVRGAIVALFRDTEREIEELTAFRETIRGLIDRYKAGYVPEAPAGAAATATTTGPRSGRVDHLGSSTHSERAWSALAGGQFDVAAREAERALELAPGDPRATTLLGWAWAAAGEGDEAVGLLERLLEENSHDALAGAAMGLALVKAGRPADAVARLEPLVTSTGDRKALLYGHHFLGLARIALGEYDAARDAWARAIELGPGLVEAYWHTGRSWYLEGDLGSAAAAWRRGAEANRFDPWAERCAEAVTCLEEGRPVSLD